MLDVCLLRLAPTGDRVLNESSDGCPGSTFNHRCILERQHVVLGLDRHLDRRTSRRSLQHTRVLRDGIEGHSFCFRSLRRGPESDNVRQRMPAAPFLDQVKLVWVDSIAIH